MGTYLKYLAVAFVIIVGLVLIATVFKDRVSREQPTSASSSSDAKDIEVIARGLSIPWEIIFLPDGNMLVTERSGRLLKIGSETKTIKVIEDVSHVGEGGLLGLTLHPNFSSNRFIYLYYTIRGTGGLENRVERYKFLDDTLSEGKVILDGVKASSNHDGGRIAFGPDGNLYITTGDAENRSLAQDKNSLNGKILRVTDEGDVPADNPFANAVYSLGHRNPQGLAWDTNGTLWETEHGPSGIQSGYDEVNVITKGGNYGWPLVYGGQTKDGYIPPIVQSGSEDTWAPSGAVFWNGSLFFAGLRGEAIYELKTTAPTEPELVTHFKGEFGRTRTVVIGPDGYLYFSTNNRDGRGLPEEDDDKIIRFRP